jgi:pyruvate/2-oxoglutarate dehydrogenase complex dihydrolipoamide acyltransferase (E2) component
VSVTRSGTTSDAQSQAAALLGGAPNAALKRVRTSATRETTGHHPAVLVAQAWRTRGIDPNTFIVAHPAGRQLAAASNVELERIVRAETGR